MANKDKLNYTKTTRFNKQQMDYLDELEEQGLTLRDVLEYHMKINTNEIQKLKNKEKCLLFDIKQTEKKLENYKNELAEVRTKLGKAPNESQLTIDVLEAKDKIINRCKIKNNGNTDDLTLANYLGTKEAERVLKTVSSAYNVNDFEEFKNRVIEALKL